MTRMAFRDADRYARWCAQHGFAFAYDKSWEDLELEWGEHCRDFARARRRSDVPHAVPDVLAAVCARTLSARDVAQPRLRAVAETLEAEPLDAESRARLLALIELAGAHGSMLVEEACFADRTFDLIAGLAGLARHGTDWIRPPSGWRPRAHGARRQFASLARHLLAEYSVPAFMDAAWMRRDPRAELFRDWFVRIGRGDNVRHSVSPVRLTKRIVHHFLRAPAHYAIEHALRWGQVHSLEGDPRVVEAVLRTRLGRELEHDAFWVTVLRFLIESDFPLRHAHLLVEYLHDRKFAPEEIYRDGRLHARFDPPQPHLSMAGRRTAPLLVEIVDWYKGARQDGTPSTWSASGLRGFERQLESSGPRTIWRLRELLSTTELHEEARAMRNCVASYAQHCMRGVASIWSLEEETPTHLRKRQTIEVRGDRIVECRGAANRWPREEDRRIVRAWAAQEGLHISDPAFDP
jgi:hypothetical protein